MDANFEIFEHTADVGIRVRADTRSDLFAGAAAALFSVTLVDPRVHELGEEVKAIRYHGLTVERRGEAWFCELIVDV